MDVSLCYQILYHTFRGIINKCNNNANLTCYNHFEGTDLPLNTHQPFLRLPISHLLSAFSKSHSPFKKGVKIKRDLFEARVFYNNSCKRSKIHSKTPSMEFFFSKVPCPDYLIRKITHAFTFFRTVFLRLYTRACFGLLFSIG